MTQVTYSKLNDALAAELCADDFDETQFRVDVDTSGTRINKIKRALNVYWRAEENAEKYGFIGVGAISFANNRLTTFCHRINLEL